jgi:hypothetical protein
MKKLFTLFATIFLFSCSVKKQPSNFPKNFKEAEIYIENQFEKDYPL